MLARVLKNRFRAVNRDFMKKLAILSEEKFRLLVLEFYNSLLDRSPSGYSLWNDDLKASVVEKFEKSLSPKEASEEWDLREYIPLVELLRLVQSKTGGSLRTNFLMKCLPPLMIFRCSYFQEGHARNKPSWRFFCSTSAFRYPKNSNESQKNESSVLGWREYLFYSSNAFSGLFFSQAFPTR